ncbi:MAG TPA: hypothetical protein VLK25_07010 [Allosphingosinicella sp.]|nr:hypothetical protein [Allosphingosinicella sp.]
MLQRIGITGAPGCGVTTLGRALATRLDAVLIDTDDHHWIDSDPPYQQKRDVPERMRRMPPSRSEPAAGWCPARWMLGPTGSRATPI